MSAPEPMPHVLPTWCYPVLIAAGAYLLWRLERWIWPWTTCLACKGAGRWREPGARKNWRDCDVCGGSGRRRRGRLR